MPYLVTKMLVSECHAIESDVHGQTIGQLVDAAVSDMLANVPPNGVPQSVEFGFDGPEDFHRFAQTNGESLATMARDSARAMRKSKRPLDTYEA